ncbi:hypothetical protein FIV42_16020 [Persicimonas caeni]|uniref:Uncharacterized protein n=1 Tax=Persicimonas caeni TaxID=2292766 RepID=A0A4Y6PV38_PERCE|nr:hypothetical protein [Persicimonas caeni]QDG52192.1 hypothetical protein FIV42_16020 [Persicimonas caeni]QED33414.1 hypothetical protein FRD00_16015 [Persicimonas caeni]
MKRLTRDKWLDKVVTDKSLADTDVTALIQLYPYLDASKTYEFRPKQLPPGQKAHARSPR